MSAAVPEHSLANLTSDETTAWHFDDPIKGSNGPLQFPRFAPKQKRSPRVWTSSDLVVPFKAQPPLDKEKNPIPMDKLKEFVDFRIRITVPNGSADERGFRMIDATTKQKIISNGKKWYPLLFKSKKSAKELVWAPSVNCKDKEDKEGNPVPLKDEDGNPVLDAEGDPVFDTYPPYANVKVCQKNLYGAQVRFAGVLDAATNQLVEEPAYTPMYDPVSKKPLSGEEGRLLKPNPLTKWRETQILLINKLGMSDEEMIETAEETTFIMGPDGEPMRCARSGRFLLQYPTASMIKGNSHVKAMLEPSMITIIENKVRMSYKAKILFVKVGDGGQSRTDEPVSIGGVTKKKGLSVEERLELARDTAASMQKAQVAETQPAEDDELAAGAGRKHGRDEGAAAGGGGSIKRSRVEDEGAEAPDGADDGVLTDTE